MSATTQSPLTRIGNIARGLDKTAANLPDVPASHFPILRRAYGRGGWTAMKAEAVRLEADYRARQDARLAELHAGLSQRFAPTPAAPLIQTPQDAPPVSRLTRLLRWVRGKFC